ncbi:hypothetical protein P8A22_18240 [Streptomyces laculatispora]|uniref:Lipoprotein n=2 Tax=Streptomyces laculatispora TaxID=887464 RepID=A0ABY9I4P1_9ACTN|nr:hypothetical protein [Streptomyces laculatispora]WLQ41755.1 hypothetical protein P8A22_18240 [Streptomyces laculatispora]
MTLALGFSLSGCVGNGKRVDMDMQDAAGHADEIMDATLASIDPAVQWAHGPTTTGSCDVTRRRSVMTVVSDQRRGSFLGLVERAWRKRDYRIKGVNNDQDSPAIYAQTSGGFGVSLIFGGGQAFFEVDSPCVEESEVVESTTPPNGPSYEGVYPLPRPNVHSDFWSAGAP